MSLGRGERMKWPRPTEGLTNVPRVRGTPVDESGYDVQGYGQNREKINFQAVHISQKANGGDAKIPQARRISRLNVVK